MRHPWWVVSAFPKASWDAIDNALDVIQLIMHGDEDSVTESRLPFEQTPHSELTVLAPGDEAN